MATAHGVASGALVRGIRPSRPRRARDHRRPPARAARSRSSTDDQIAIGSRMAYRMGLGLGDRLTLISPQGTPTAFGTVPRVKAYEIGAIFEVGMYEYDSTLIYMPLEAAQLYFQLDDRANELEIMVADPDRVAALPAGAGAAGRRRRPAGRLAAGQRLVLHRAQGRAQRDVPDPEPDHHGRRLQHHLGHDHAGEGQGPRHRDPADHGRHPGRDHARVLHERRRDRRHRHARGLPARARCSPPTSRPSGSGCRC